MKAKTKRNQKIYNDKKSGVSWTELIKKYNLSYTTLKDIINRIELKRLKKEP